MITIPYNTLSSINGEVAQNLIKTAAEYARSAQGREFLAKVILPTDGTLAVASDGSGLLGMVMNNGKLVSNARIIPYAEGASQAGAAATSGAAAGGAAGAGISAPVLATVIVIAVALVGIEVQVSQIRAGQNMILKLLEDDKRASLEGDIDFLLDLTDNCAFCWNDEKYKEMSAHRAQHIRIDAHRYLNYFKTQIADLLDSDKLHSATNSKKLILKLQELFECYQYSVYLYALAYYMEVILSGAKETAFLKDVIAKIQKESLVYREEYSARYNQMRTYLTNSFEAKASMQAGSAVKAVGEVVSKIPLLNKGQIDETLIEKGGSLEAISDKNAEKMLRPFVKLQSVNVSKFTDNLQELDLLFHHPMEILVSEDHLTLCQVGEVPA